MPRKPAEPTSPKRRRASVAFSSAGDLDKALDDVAHRHIGEALDARWHQMNLDQLVVRAIRAANAVDHDLPVRDFARVVSAMLSDLVANGVVNGTLPSDERLTALVTRQIKAGRGASSGDDDLNQLEPGD